MGILTTVEKLEKEKNKCIIFGVTGHSKGLCYRTAKAPVLAETEASVFTVVPDWCERVDPAAHLELRRFTAVSGGLEIRI